MCCRFIWVYMLGKSFADTGIEFNSWGGHLLMLSYSHMLLCIIRYVLILVTFEWSVTRLSLGLSWSEMLRHFRPYLLSR